jgi:hypothetical protein
MEGSTLDEEMKPREFGGVPLPQVFFFFFSTLLGLELLSTRLSSSMK